MDYRIKNINNITKNQYDEIYSKLNNNVRNRIDNFKTKKRKQQSLLGFILLEELLKNENILFESVFINYNHKPTITNLNIHFNISHSNDLVVCVTSKNPVGVDIEYLKSINLKTIKVFENNLKPSTNKDFFDIWTKKEAVYKLDNSMDFKTINTKQFEFKTINLNNYIINICEKTTDIHL